MTHPDLSDLYPDGRPDPEQANINVRAKNAKARIESPFMAYTQLGVYIGNCAAEGRMLERQGPSKHRVAVLRKARRDVLSQYEEFRALCDDPDTREAAAEDMADLDAKLPSGFKLDPPFV